MIKKYLIFLSILVFLLVVRFQINIFNFVGEKLFLTFHRDDLAMKVLEIPRYKNSETYYLLGRLNFVNGNLEKSVQLFSSAIEQDPNIKEYYYNRGLSFGFMSPIFYENAISDFQKYIEIDNQEFEKTGHHAYGAWAGYNDLAWIYFLNGDFANAENTAREGLKISPVNPWLSNMLGTTLLEQQKCNEAISDLEYASTTLAKITNQQFGEAYSGDSPDFWPIGKNQMQKSINDNLEICKKMK